jgi:hypothetical protein
VIVIIKLTVRKSKNKNGKVMEKLNKIRAAKIRFTVSLHPHNMGSHHGLPLLSDASKPSLQHARRVF